jgi:hypothetical protein
MIWLNWLRVKKTPQPPLKIIYAMRKLVLAIVMRKPYIDYMETGKPTARKTKMTYEIFGGDNGSYKITEGDKVAPVAFVRRNETGGGYTVRTADESKTVQMRNMPRENQAAEIMAMLK